MTPPEGLSQDAGTAALPRAARGDGPGGRQQMPAGDKPKPKPPQPAPPPAPMPAGDGPGGGKKRR